jgi:4-hydroxy-tetrahydrodipicolinate synthase
MLEELQKMTDAIGEIYQKGRTLNQSLPALKIMMNTLHLCESYVLPPLEMLGEEERKQISAAMKNFNFHEETHTV